MKPATGSFDASANLGGARSCILALSLAVAVGLVPSLDSIGTDPTLHPIAAPGDFELHPALELSLFACEPDVVDPVALTFDEFGRAYVVEMRDYPYGFGPDRKPGGTVRLLEDTDGDGRVDRSTVFAENLSFPTSIACWNGGVLVTAPPQILFLKDTDGDGRADIREVVVDGFRLSVTDSNVNGLRYALDNWFHGANGGNGGGLTAPKRGGAPVPLADRDFRFRPASGDIELTTHTGGGFGLVFDEWGRSFTTYNIDHLQQRVADAGWFSRFPGLPPVHTTLSISDHEEMARIFPISPAVTRPNHPEQAGYFSASGGMGYLGHPGWPDDLPGSVFVGDVVGNLVHRDLLRPDGPILRATRAPGEQTREFFASRDNSFRPVGLEPGPDGAMYLIDMQRDVIEHPDYIPKRLLEKLDLRAGDDRGRIYRIAPKGWSRQRELPGRAAPKELVGLLGAANPWTRLTAQRLLVARADRALVPELARLATNAAPLARLHALWTLDGLGALSVERIVAALDAREPQLRWNALRLAAGRVRSEPRLGAPIAARLNDPDPEVRFVAALVAGDLETVPAAGLLELLKRDRASAWTRRAALASLGPRTGEVIGRLLDDRGFWANAGPPRLQLARDFMEVAAATRPGPALDAAFLDRLGRLAGPVEIALLEGTAQGLDRRAPGPGVDQDVARRMAGMADSARTPEFLAAVLRVNRKLGLPPTPGEKSQFDRWLTGVTNATLAIAERVEITHLLALGDFRTTGGTLFGLLRGTEPGPVQQAALAVVREQKDPAVGAGLVQAWPSLPPVLRPTVVNLLVYRHAFHEALLAALEAGTLQVGELNLDLEHRRELLRKSESGIRERAAKFVSDEEYSNRRTAVDEWLAKLPASGDPASGRGVFERICAQCHFANGLGFRVGPELTGMSHRSVEDLLSNILDPNMAMNPAFVAFTAELTDGESETGILVSQGSEGVTLMQAGGRKVEIARAKLRELKSGGRSLMPEGLEAGLSPKDLRDVIAFLQMPAAKP